MWRNRIIWGVLWIASIVGISLYGGAVSYGIFVALTLVPIISLIYLFYVYSCFHIYQELGNRTLCANQNISFYFRLVNENLMSFTGVRVKFFSSFSTISGLSDETEYELLPGTHIKRETTLSCKYRGRYKVGIKSVEIQDFFRLFRVSYHNPSELSVIVNPEVIYLDSLDSIDIQRVVRDSKQEPSRLDVLAREYVPGDDLRRIHWSMSAKSGKLMTREKIGEEQHGVGIILDTMRYSESDKEYLPIENKMLETVLAIILFLAEKRIPAREFHLAERLKVHNVEGLSQFDEFYEKMSDIEFSRKNEHKALFTKLEYSNDIYGLQAVFMVMHTWSVDGQRLLERLFLENIFVVIYLVNDDKALDIQIPKSNRIRVVRIASDDDLKEVL